jgi:hypothetical protein
VKCHLSELEKVKVRALGGQGLAPKDILCILRKEFANNHLTVKEIYNELVATRCYLNRGVERPQTGNSKKVKLWTPLLTGNNFTFFEFLIQMFSFLAM